MVAATARWGKAFMFRLIALILLVAWPASARNSELDARTILERAAEAAGGEAWLDPRTLQLAGTAEFYGPEGSEPRSRADDYRMWRVFNPDRTASHGADGMVRIRAAAGDRVIFEVGYDGETTWTQDGVLSREEADEYWASAFGFGIIRRALGSGFTLRRVADGNVRGHATYKLHITDPNGGETLFGFDRDSFAIRSMEFMTPRGWHERIYDDFYRLADTGWLQAGRVSLSYNGILANEVFWTEARVDEPIPDSLFSYPGEE